MRNSRIIMSGLLILVVGGVIWFGYKAFFSATPQLLFKTQKPEKRDVYKAVQAEGSLEVQGTSRLGCLIQAKVKKIHVKEGQKVTKGTLLAELENDKGGDADVRRTKALLAQAHASLAYSAARYKREEAIYKAGQLSKDAFDKVSENYQRAEKEVELTQAVYDKEVFLLEQTRVQAPHGGIVVAIMVEEGEAISPAASPPQVLFEIAQDLEKMKASIYIDESNIGSVHVGMQSAIMVDTYPDRRPWKGIINSISMSKSLLPSTQAQSAGVTYKAEVFINNSESLLRPGMSVHAKIFVAKAKQVLSVPGFVFQLNSKVLEAAANVMKYKFVPIPALRKKELLRQASAHPIKTLWVIQGNNFIEKAVEIGITDSAYFQILSGLQEADDVIADDMTASEELKKLAKLVTSS